MSTRQSVRLAGVVCAALLWCSWSAVGQATVHYENDEMGFALYYPESWSVLDEEAGYVSFLSSGAVETEDAPGAGMVLMSIDLSVLGVDSLAGAFEQASAGMTPGEGTVFGDLQDLEIAGLPALAQPMEDDNEGISGQLIGLVSGETFYFILTAVHPQDLKVEYDPVFSAMLSSLEFFEPVLADEDWFDLLPDEDDLDYADEPAGIINVYADGDLGLQEAIDQAQPGATIYIHEGVYNNDVTILIEGKLGLTITGRGEVWLICSDIYENVVTVSYSEGIELTSLKARHEEWLAEYECHGSVLHIEESTDIYVFDSELNGCGGIGVAAYYSESVTVENCLLHRNSLYAVYLYSTNDVSLYYNTIVNNRSFLYASEVFGLEIEGNEISGNDEWFGDGY